MERTNEEIAKMVGENLRAEMNAMKAKWSEGVPTERIELVGSEKQIAWATKIRETTVKKMTEMLGDEEISEKTKFFEWLLSKQESKWWIEKGQAVASEIVMMYQKEVA